MKSHHPTILGGRRHCGSGDMFLLVEGQDSAYPCFNPILLFISKEHDLEAHRTAKRFALNANANANANAKKKEELRFQIRV